MTPSVVVAAEETRLSAGVSGVCKSAAVLVLLDAVGAAAPSSEAFFGMSIVSTFDVVLDDEELDSGVSPCCNGDISRGLDPLTE